MTPCNCPRTILGVRLVIITHTCKTEDSRIEYGELSTAA